MNSKRKLISHFLTYKLCSVRIYFQLFVGGFMSCLIYVICVGLLILYCVFCFACLRPVYAMLPVSLDYSLFDCPIGIL